MTRSASPATEGIKMKKVLIVDDSALIRRQVGNALRAAGYDVVEAMDGQDAYEKLAANPDTTARANHPGRIPDLRASTRSSSCTCMESLLAARRAWRRACSWPLIVSLDRC